MREIKFRGKRLDNGEWIYGDLLHIAGGCIIYYGSQTESELIEGLPDMIIELYMDEVAPVDPDTVGQFTGLCDCKGNEIYEGDIVRTSVSKNGIALVEWHCEHAAFVVQMKGSDQWYHLYKGYEKIGNIHDNPSLLEVGLKCFTL